MPDTQDAESPADVKPSEMGKKAVRGRKAKAEPGKPGRKKAAGSAAKASDAPAATARATRRTYSGKERAQLLGQIEKAIAGGATVRNAVGEAGISEQTYYHWKKVATPVKESGDLKDLLALEDENKRLKAMLAERLRKENAELKKKLGLS